MIHFVIHVIYFFSFSSLLFPVSILPFSSCSQKYLHNYNIRKMAIANPFQELILSQHYVPLPLEKSTYLCGKIQLFCSLCSLPSILIIIPGNKGRRNPPSGISKENLHLHVHHCELFFRKFHHKAVY